MTTRSGKAYRDSMINRQTNKHDHSKRTVLLRYCHLIPSAHLQGSKIQYGIFLGFILVQGFCFTPKRFLWVIPFAPPCHLKSRVPPWGKS